MFIVPSLETDPTPPAPAPERIGLYGGSFDPIHLGHLILARDALEQLGLSRLVFLPAAISPHKLGRAPGASGEDRLAMVRAAVAGEARFSVDPCELRRDGPSYTVDTVRVLLGRLAAGTRLFYLIGEDNLPALDTWHRAEELRELVQFVVCQRRIPGQDLAAVEQEHGFPTVARCVEISSTEVRKRVAGGLSIRYLVPKGVEAIIRARQLYRTTAFNSGGTPPLPPNC